MFIIEAGRKPVSNCNSIDNSSVDQTYHCDSLRLAKKKAKDDAVEKMDKIKQQKAQKKASTAKPVKLVLEKQNNSSVVAEEQEPMQNEAEHFFACTNADDNEESSAINNTGNNNEVSITVSSADVEIVKQQLLAEAMSENKQLKHLNAELSAKLETLQSELNEVVEEPEVKKPTRDADTKVNKLLKDPVERLHAEVMWKTDLANVKLRQLGNESDRKLAAKDEELLEARHCRQVAEANLSGFKEKFSKMLADKVSKETKQLNADLKAARAALQESVREKQEAEKRLLQKDELLCEKDMKIKALSTELRKFSWNKPKLEKNLVLQKGCSLHDKSVRYTPNIEEKSWLLHPQKADAELNAEVGVAKKQLTNAARVNVTFDAVSCLEIEHEFVLHGSSDEFSEFKTISGSERRTSTPLENENALLNGEDLKGVDMELSSISFAPENCIFSAISSLDCDLTITPKVDVSHSERKVVNNELAGGGDTSSNNLDRGLKRKASEDNDLDRSAPMQKKNASSVTVFFGTDLKDGDINKQQASTTNDKHPDNGGLLLSVVGRSSSSSIYINVVRCGGGFNYDTVSSLETLVTNAYDASLSTFLDNVQHIMNAERLSDDWQCAINCEGALGFYLCCGGQKRMIQFYIETGLGRFAHVVFFRAAECYYRRRVTSECLLKHSPALEVVAADCVNSHIRKYGDQFTGQTDPIAQDFVMRNRWNVGCHWFVVIGQDSKVGATFSSEQKFSTSVSVGALKLCMFHY